VSNILESQDYSDGVNSPRQLEVLVVQSNPADPVPTLEAFKVAGATNGLNCVMDGDDALMYVRREGKYAQKAIPDLIFLDLSQPRTSGLEFLKILKSTESLIHIPIVVRAGWDDPEFCKEGIRAERQLLHAKTWETNGVRQVHKILLRFLE
jgi:CheY-like chemotaxis protein